MKEPLTGGIEKTPGTVKCLGWCGKEFLSPDKCRIRFCKQCATKKEQAERSQSKIRNMGDGVQMHGD